MIKPKDECTRFAFADRARTFPSGHFPFGDYIRLLIISVQAPAILSITYRCNVTRLITENLLPTLPPIFLYVIVRDSLNRN